MIWTVVISLILISPVHLCEQDSIEVTESSVEVTESSVEVTESSVEVTESSVEVTESSVGFTAGFQSNQIIPQGGRVAYELVYTNDGRGYNETSGVFKAPTSGLYLFIIAGLNQVSKGFLFDLYRNENYMISSYTSSVIDRENSANPTVVRLVTGDRVYVKARFRSSVTGTQSAVYATFTGILVGQLEPEASAVGFTAGFISEKTIPPRRRVAYEQTFTNEGRGYNATSGVFTAPKGGLYLFIIAALNQVNKPFLFDLYRNEDFMITLFGGQAARTSSANGISLRLIKGDRVYVQTRFAASGVFGSPKDVYTTFTGILVGTSDYRDGNVGFTAGFKTHQTIRAGGRVAYDQVFTNDGNGYNAISGVFTAPKAGLYLFFISELNQPNKLFLFDLYHNDDYMISSFGSRPTGHVSAANDVVLRLERGDTVYVGSRILSSVFGTEIDVYATFTGVLVGI